MGKLHVLFAASEVYPFAKSGGLADVAHSLPVALSAHVHVDVILPLYSFIDRKHFGIMPEGEGFEVMMGGISYPVTLYRCEYEGLSYHFVYTPLLCDREYLYGTPQGGYEDNDLRFGLFNYALLALLKKEKYDIAHLNDWQCALLALLLQEVPEVKTKTLFTIHNLAYQGVFSKSALATLGIDEKYFTMDGVEFYGKVNLMKAGIGYADKITTVSPTYAKEILTPEFGCGLEGFLAYHSGKLRGILNGIDSEHFTPSKDKLLVKPYSDLVGKAVNKRAYLKELGFAHPDRPLVVFIGRFTWQKGLELLVETVESMLGMECNIAILGDGEAQYQHTFESMVQKHENLHYVSGYDEALSHRMYAASDFFLMPSLFEPCGLAQMIAMAYGSLPIVHSVGGLADTVMPYEDFDKKSPKGYGIVFLEAEAKALLHAFSAALTLYANKKSYNTIAKHNMACDYSWQQSVELYINEYKTLLKESIDG